MQQIILTKTSDLSGQGNLTGQGHLTGRGNLTGGGKNLMLKCFVLLYLSILFSILSNAQTISGSLINASSKPKLIVAIVVDQMRYDYLTRYWNKFGNDGFKKLVSQGFSCTNTHYNYVPTYTGPGHASIFTGTTPAIHGIISNDWFDRKLGRNIYVTSDPNVTGVGTDSLAGKMSPVNLLSTTFTDELRLASNLKSKVIGIALKDRSAILPAGHAANAAYWFESATGNFISSSWYLKSLPQWVIDFNNKKLPYSYLQKPWTTLLPIEEYTESSPDDAPYEDLYFGEKKPTFPHNFNILGPNNFEFVRRSPAGNTLTKEFALATIKSEELGKDEFTDVLTVSFSSTDYVGHQFGTNAIETEDTYLRLDSDLADLIKQVETYCGKENVLFFLTADHGAIQNVQFLIDQKIPAGIFNVAMLSDSLQKFLASEYGQKKWVLTVDNDQVFLDRKLIAENKLDLNHIADEVASFLMRFEDISRTLTAKTLNENEFTSGLNGMVQRGFNRQRSADVAFVLNPGYIEYSLKGTTHGSAYMYDTHVPLFFYGWKIKPGVLAAHVDITDIAPTISQILGIQPPSGCNGKVIEELLKK